MARTLALLLDLKLLTDAAAAYEIPFLMNAGEVPPRLPAAHHRCPVMTPHLPGGFQLAHMAGDADTVIGALQFLNGDGFWERSQQGKRDLLRH